MSTSAEKLVKQTIKLISKTIPYDYEQLKTSAKKVIKMARNYDDELLGLMEELLDLSQVTSEEELDEFSIDVIKLYCRVKDIDTKGSEKSLKARVWKIMESEFEIDSEDLSDSESEPESEPEPEPEPESLPKKKKKNKSTDVVIG